MKKMIGEKIKKLRIANNLNQKELAEKLNITQASLSTYETGIKLPSLDTLKKISEYFGKSLDDLYKDYDSINQEVKNSASKNEKLTYFSERLSILIKKLNMNIVEFSDYVGISRTTVYRIC